MKLVLDTNTVISAMLWGGTPGLLLQAAQDREINLFRSSPLLTELHEVLIRRKFNNKIAASPYSVKQLATRYAILAALVIPEHTLRIVFDPKDDVVLGTAKVAQADYIVSGDDHLLRLKTFEGIPILRAAAAVEYMRLER